MRSNDYVIIMAGGIGSRFWPMSRQAWPKQFHDILGTGKTLIQMTYERYADFIPPQNILIVTNQRYADLVKEQLPDVTDAQLLLEPVGRNTAPCIAYASYKIRKMNPKASIMVAASDHLILNRENFRRDIEYALDHVRHGNPLVTLGIRPTRPDTGYGYIQFIEEEATDTRIFRVKTFTEKPELEMAKTFLRSGDFLWNSGMFVFAVDTIIDAFQTHMPDLSELFEAILPQLGTGEEPEAIRETYAKCRNESIDFGVMEKANNVFVIPATFDWSDLGTWGSMYEHMEKDYLGNAVQGNIMIYESTNNVIRIADSKKLVVVDGLDDFIVVDTGDALLICKKEDEQNIKRFVADIKDKGGMEKLV